MVRHLWYDRYLSKLTCREFTAFSPDLNSPIYAFSIVSIIRYSGLVLRTGKLIPKGIIMSVG